MNYIEQDVDSGPSTEILISGKRQNEWRENCLLKLI